MKKTIICFGDSNTHGYNPADGARFQDTERWTGLLQEYLGDVYLIREEGMSGRTTVFEDPLFEGLSGLSAIHLCLMTHEPVDLLIIMLGTNDTKERFGVNAENIAKGLDRLVAKAISSKEAWRNGIPNILLIAPVPIHDAYATSSFKNEMGKGCSEKSRQLASLYENVAKKHNCRFLDAASIEGINVHPNDYMHLDKNSHQLLAQTLLAFIPCCF